MKKAILTMVLFAFIAQIMLLAQQVTDVDLYTLLSDWDSNKIRVQQNYHNKTIRTEGEVSTINADGSMLLSVGSIELYARGMLGMILRTSSLRVNFNSSERSKLANLNRGQYITITGVYDGDRNVINRAVIGTDSATTAQANTYNESGVSFFNQRNWDSAIAQFTEAIRLEPNNATFYSNRGNAYRQKGDHDRSITDYTQAIRLEPTADRYNSRGNTYRLKSDYDRAISDYTEAIRLDPNNAVFYFNRGGTYTFKNDWDRVIADYTEAIRLAPNEARYYNNRADAYDEKREYDRAIADYTQAIRLDSNYELAYYGRGLAYGEKRDWDRAIDDFTQAIRIAPNDHYNYYQRANAHNQKGNYAQARADVNRSLQINANYQSAKDLDAELKRRGY